MESEFSQRVTEVFGELVVDKKAALGWSREGPPFRQRIPDCLCAREETRRRPHAHSRAHSALHDRRGQEERVRLPSDA